MSDPPVVTIVQASTSDAATVANLLQLYIHDLSDVFPTVELGSDGRFRYDRLPLYWTETDRRFVFLIHSEGNLAGFAFVTRGSPVSDDPDVFDLAEFFVIRRFRRAGVGGEAARLLWATIRGNWTVRVVERNTAALEFWEEVIRGTFRDVHESILPRDPNVWRVYTFDSTELDSQR
jgi:predicted acetyltransferase